MTQVVSFFLFQCHPVPLISIMSVVVHLCEFKSGLLKVFNFLALPENTHMPSMRVQSGDTGNKDYDGGLLALACTFPISLLNE